MNKTKYEYACPVCGIAVQLWRCGECTFHHYFQTNRVKHETYKELVGAFLEEHPDVKGKRLDGRNVK